MPGLPALGDELAWSQAAFSRESVAVDALIRSALDTAEPMLRSSRVELDYAPSEGLPKLALQLAPTKQAFLNILTVALDWLAEGRLVVRAEHQPGDRQVSRLNYRLWRARIDGGRAGGGAPARGARTAQLLPRIAASRC